MIPPIAHFVWLGGQIPEVVQGIIGEFSDLHPRWDVRIHRELPEDLPDGLSAAIGRCTQWCQVADILYCHLLCRYGGMVLDTDVVAVRSFDPLLVHEPAFTTRHNDKDKRLTNAVMGSVPESYAFKLCCEYIAARGTRPPAQRAAYGPAMLTELFDGKIRRHHEHKAMNVLPWHYFYPLLINERAECAEFLDADSDRRRQLVDATKPRWVDGVAPFGVHLWYALGSSFTEVAPRARKKAHR